jgi:hypothetical protein
MRILPLALALLLPALAPAGETAPKTLLAECGPLLFSETLAQPPAEPVWKAAKGEWKVVDGAWRGGEREADNHGAVVRHPIALTNFVLRCEVRLDGAKGVSLSINGMKDHLARVGLGARGVQVRKDDRDHDGPDKAKAFPSRLDSSPAHGEWHTLVLEMAGDTMLATFDGEVAGFGSDEALAAPKANFGFTVAGEHASFRNVAVWSAVRRADWARTRAGLEAAK